MKAVSGAICEWVATPFSLTVYESTGLCGMANHSSPVKADSGAISKWSATQFSLTFYDSTGVGRAEDSLCHLCKPFP